MLNQREKGLRPYSLQPLFNTANFNPRATVKTLWQTQLKLPRQQRKPKKTLQPPIPTSRLSWSLLLRLSPLLPALQSTRQNSSRVWMTNKRRPSERNRESFISSFLESQKDKAKLQALQEQWKTYASQVYNDINHIFESNTEAGNQDCCKKFIAAMAQDYTK